MIFMYRAVSLMERVMELLPHETSSLGWVTVTSLKSDIYNPSYSYLEAENKMKGMTVSAWVKSNNYHIDELLELVKVVQKDANFMGLSKKGYDRHYIRQWNDNEIGTNFGGPRDMADVEIQIRK